AQAPFQPSMQLYDHGRIEANNVAGQNCKFWRFGTIACCAARMQSFGLNPVVAAWRKSRRIAQMRSPPRRVLFGLVLCFACAAGSSEGWTAEARHGIAMHGEPGLPAGFTQLRYANPAAPKGGRLVQGI